MGSLQDRCTALAIGTPSHGRVSYGGLQFIILNRLMTSDFRNIKLAHAHQLPTHHDLLPRYLYPVGQTYDEDNELDGLMRGHLVIFVSVRSCSGGVVYSDVVRSCAIFTQDRLQW